jgi:hypothetical protein
MHKNTNQILFGIFYSDNTNKKLQKKSQGYCIIYCSKCIVVLKLWPSKSCTGYAVIEISLQCDGFAVG